MDNNDIVIVAAGRSAVGNFGGSLTGVPASTLRAQVIAGLVAQTGINPATIDEVIMGHVLTAGLATLCIGGGMGIALAVERA